MSKNKYVKLGVLIDDLEAVTEEIKNLLKIPFSHHESDYWGLYNLAEIEEKGTIRIVNNFVDEDWQVEDRKDCPLLIELNRLHEPEKITKMICENLSYIVPLHMEEIEPGEYIRKYIFADGQPKLVDEYFY